MKKISCSKIIALSLPVAMFLSSTLMTTGAEPESPCSAGAYVIDKDSAGLNIRDTPKGKIINKIPSGAMVTITEEKDSWVKISDATYPDEGDFAKKNGHKSTDGFVTLNNINGWVSIKMIGTSVRKYSKDDSVWLYSKPSESSGKIIEVTDMEPQVNITGCSKKWLKVIYKKKEGWLHPDTNCPNTLTSCS